MKKLFTVFLIIVFYSTSWGTTIFVGVDSDIIVIWEYWKFEDGIKTNEVFIYNPTDKEISIEFKKYHYKKQNWFKRLFSKNSLLKIKSLKAGDYLLYKQFRSTVMGRSNGTIEVLVNDEKIGLYGGTKKSNMPIGKIQNGIIINQLFNNGQNLFYETVYNQLKFNENSELNAEIKYVDTTFSKMGFPLPGNNNDDEIVLNIIGVDNLNVEKNKDYQFIVSSAGKTGILRLNFANNKSKMRISQLMCNFKATYSEGLTRFCIPKNISFEEASRYYED